MNVSDRKIIISVGNSRKDRCWKQVSLTVAELYNRLSAPVRGMETYDDYMRFKKTQQDDLKDVGGFVGGSLNGSRRNANCITGRDVITLDFDNIPGWQTDAVIGKVAALGCNYCVYSTRKHTPSAPRLRILVPLDRTVTPDEYEPCARRIAQQIGIEMADKTTFDINRLMYWPSCCSDAEYVFRTDTVSPLISADFLLSTYTDWHDLTSWPQVPNATSYKKLAAKQGDPTEKNGIVGSFCRTYNVLQAMDTFIPGVYEPCANMPERYTYLGGSTTGGAIVYEGGQFLFSHHATDPCSGRLVNAFDLVRLHKFGDMDADKDPDTPISKLPSYNAMSQFALQDKKTLATINREQLEQINQDFGGIAGAGNGGTTATQTPTADGENSWLEELDRTEKGIVKGTIDNVLILLDNDPQLHGKFALNAFAGRGEVLGALPWNNSAKRRLWSDTDSNGLYWYLERYWQITKRGSIDSALDVHATLHAFNEVQDFISHLQWDGVKRLDTLFIDYLGADDTAYNRAVTRKAFTAAVARAMIPGCKFDNMLILAGPQGIGKSTILDKMSKGWFNDSIRTFEGKEASELLQGVWLVEVGELDAFRRTDVSRIKQFLSLRADRYRAAYGRHVKEQPRCCVFFGTTNTTDFLQDSTGNRRFWPVDVGVSEKGATRSVFTDLTDDTISQIWAEAKVYWQCGEPLYLTGAIEADAREKQEEHREVNVREGLIAEFINREVPADWQKWDIQRRRDYWNGATRLEGGATLEAIPRDRISAIEVWCECFGGNPKDMKTSDTREINSIISQFSAWERAKKVMRFGPYDVQRGFVRKG